MAKQLSVGAARWIMTPPVGVPTGGGGPDGYTVTTYVLDQLYARALYLTDTVAEYMVFQLDLLGLSRTKAGRICRAVADGTGIPESNILIMCPQSHNSGTTFSGRYPEQELAAPLATGHCEWFNDLDEKALRAAHQARKAARPVTAAVGHGHCDTVAAGRRAWMKNGHIGMAWSDPDPDQVDHWNPIDPGIIVVRFNDLATSEPLAAIWHYSCHPNSLWMMPCFTRDYPGVVEDALTERYGNDFIALFANGFCGDVDTYRNMRVTKDVYTYPFYKEPGKDLSINIVEMQRLGRILAEKVVAVTENAADHHGNWQELAILRDTVEYDLRPDDDTLNYSDYYDPQVETVVFRLGPVALACAPFEPMTALGMRLKEKSCAPVTIPVGHTPFYLGYLPDEIVCRQKGFEYGTDWRPFADDVGPRVTESLLEKIAKLFG